MKKENNSKIVLFVIIGVLILIVVGVGILIYLLLSNNEEETTTGGGGGGTSGGGTNGGGTNNGGTNSGGGTNGGGATEDVPNIELCQTTAESPSRMNIWFNDPNCVSKFGWNLRKKIKVWSTPGVDSRSKFTAYVKGSPDRAYIVEGDYNTTDQKIGEFYAYSNEEPGTTRNCVMVPQGSRDDVSRQVMYDDCQDAFGWTNYFEFYAK
jgi:hypothetical protein